MGFIRDLLLPASINMQLPVQGQEATAATVATVAAFGEGHLAGLAAGVPAVRPLTLRCSRHGEEIRKPNLPR